MYIGKQNMWYYTNRVTSRASSSIFDKEKNKEVEEKFDFFYLPKDLFEAIDFTEIEAFTEREDLKQKYVIGDTYMLKGASCDGFEMSEKTYELKGLVDNFHDVPINAVIVKQLSGDKGHIFTLSKNDCKYLNIEYEDGLQLFPKGMPWVHIRPKETFVSHDLGTTPLSEIDGTVRDVVFKLRGFRDYRDGYIITPSNHLIKEGDFLKTLTIISIEPLVYNRNYVFNGDRSYYQFSVIKPKKFLFNHGNFISSDDEIFVRIMLTISAKDKKFFGAEKEYLKGIDPNEFFQIYWDEYGTVTVEEYEAEQKRKKEQAIKEAKKAREEREKIIREIATIKSEAKRIMLTPQYTNLNPIKFTDFDYEHSSFMDIATRAEYITSQINGITRQLEKILELTCEK